MTQVLVLYYSHTGQVETAVRRLVQGYESRGWLVTCVRLTEVTPYPKPLSLLQFFGLLPEVLGNSCRELCPLPKEILQKPFDRLVLATPVWFLGLPPPVKALFLTREWDRLRVGEIQPLLVARQMWHMAHQDLLERLRRSPKGPIREPMVLTHQGNSWQTLLTAPLAATRKHRPYRSAQVAPEMFSRLEAYAANFSPNPIQIDPRLPYIEKVIHTLFCFWARLIPALSKPKSLHRPLLIMMLMGFITLTAVTVLPILYFTAPIYLSLRKRAHAV